MIEYSVVLKRFPGSAKPDVCIFRDEDKEKAIKAMADYDRKYGFSIQDSDGRYTIAGIHLVEKKPVVGEPILHEWEYLDIFDYLGRRRTE